MAPKRKTGLGGKVDWAWRESGALLYVSPRKTVECVFKWPVKTHRTVLREKHVCRFLQEMPHLRIPQTLMRERRESRERSG